MRPIMADGMSELIDDKHKITDEVWSESTPGHTPVISRSGFPPGRERGDHRRSDASSYPMPLSGMG